jgi:hypothetical protein
MADGVSWRYSSARARRELDFSSTPLDLALAQTLVQMDRRSGRWFKPSTEIARVAVEQARGEQP